MRFVEVALVSFVAGAVVLFIYRAPVEAAVARVKFEVSALVERVKAFFARF